MIAAVIWVGGDITLTTLGIVFERRQEGDTLAALGRMGAWIGVKVYTPALFVVIAFGLALMHEGDHDWGQFWVIFGLVGWAVAALIGVGFVGPELGRIDEAARAHGPDSAEVAARVKRLFMIFRFDTVLLILIVINMAAKPTFLIVTAGSELGGHEHGPAGDLALTERVEDLVDGVERVVLGLEDDPARRVELQQLPEVDPRADEVADHRLLAGRRAPPTGTLTMPP